MLALYCCAVFCGGQFFVSAVRTSPVSPLAKYVEAGGAKKIANHAQAQQQEKTRADERHAPQKEQQLTSTMLSYLPMVRTLQHWREWDSSSGGMATVLYLMTAARNFVCTRYTARISRASILRTTYSTYFAFESRQAGARQFFVTYNCTPNIPGNTDSKPLPAEIGNKQNNTLKLYKTTALLHTNNHEQQYQENDDESWQATKQQVCQKQETSS